MSFKYLFRILPILFLFAFLSSCSKKNDIVCYFLIDYSNSTKDSLTRLGYLEDFNKVISELEGGEVIFLDKITANTSATSSPLELIMPSYDLFTHNVLTYEKQRDSTVREFLKLSTEYFFNPAEEATDIINSVPTAKTVLDMKSFSNHRKYLFIFSDMIQETKELALMRQSLDDKNIESLLNSIQDKIPDLKDIEVYVTGAGHVKEGSKSIEIKKLDRIKKFWLRYFEKAGTELEDDHYSTRLIHFDF